MVMPPGSHVFQPIKITFTASVEGNPRTIVPNYFQIGKVVFDMKIFKEFCMKWNSSNIFKRGPPRIILLKFDDNPSSGLGGNGTTHIIGSQ